MTGSADPQVVSTLAIFRRTRSAGDALPAGARVGESLAAAGAVSYDPADAVRLRRIGARGGVYAVPATMSLAGVTAACAGLPPSSGASGFLALEGEQTGSGPGACLISTRFARDVTSNPPLPGSPASQPMLSVAEVSCESDVVLSGYAGALGDGTGAGTGFALIPDGISTISYTLAVPSRTPIAIPGPIKADTSCEVGALVTSTHPGPVHVTLQTGG